MEDAESLLSDWFGAPVVLTSSGRAGLRICFEDLGLSRYRDKVAMSPKSAACVLDAVIRSAFPVDAGVCRSGAAATLLIQQYGFVQRVRPAGLVIEDISHAFYATAETGARDWCGDYAVFSLPKFFSLAGMAGGIVARSEEIAERLRKRLSGCARDESASARERAVFRATERSQLALETMYLARLLNAAPDPGSLDGLPDMEGLRDAGRKRRAIVDCLMQVIPRHALPEEWRSALLRNLPFALPYFGSRGELSERLKLLEGAGVESGIYEIDSRRDMANPEWKTALLVPCHHLLSSERCNEIAEILS